METERLQRYRYEIDPIEAKNKDYELEERIILLLNDDRITSHCMVDAYYYDFSVIPDKIVEELHIYRDAYQIFGISEQGEFISKWVERYDLDSHDPIGNGNVIRDERKFDGTITSISLPPQIIEQFSKDMLSTYAPKFLEEKEEIK